MHEFHLIAPDHWQWPNPGQSYLSVNRTYFMDDIINADLWKWVKENVTEYQLVDGLTEEARGRIVMILQIKDPEEAMLFKLTWI